MLENKENNIIPSNFIRNIVMEDLASGKHKTIITRFPPEPNGYLHIGHAKAICLNFGLAKEFGGKCNLRFDDTNPEKETEEFVVSIKNTIQQLGFKWDGEVKYASDYFDKLYSFAQFFIKQGLAYVCDLTLDEIRNYRGDLIVKGVDSPYRNRGIEENLELFNQMRNGEFADGSKTLRLKIDMSSPNINMRDPVIYRIKRAHHIRTHDKWCIYPMYDYTHCISDALEGITHSCCSLEFEDHRPLYDWIIGHLFVAKLVNCHPRQIEFSRLELEYAVTSKRKLNQLVTEGVVDGWDDPRLSTLMGMFNRGYTADGIRLFINRCGVSKAPNIVGMDLLENSIREELEPIAPRIMTVVRPLKITLTNFIHGESLSREAAFHPQNSELGSRICELTPEIYIEQNDFQENPESGFQRLTVGGEVRLRHSYVIKCDEIIKDATGQTIELLCSIDHNTLGKNPEGRKVRGVIHWVSITKSIPIEVRLYDTLFTRSAPDKIIGYDFKQFINPNSLEVVIAYMEPSGLSLLLSEQVKPVQFERIGYFVFNPSASEINQYKLTNTWHNDDRIVFNRTVTLKDNWRK